MSPAPLQVYRLCTPPTRKRRLITAPPHCVHSPPRLLNFTPGSTFEFKRTEKKEQKTKNDIDENNTPTRPTPHPPLQNFWDHLGQSHRGVSEVSREQHAKLSRTHHRNIIPERNSYQMGSGIFIEVDYLPLFFGLHLPTSDPPAGGEGTASGKEKKKKKRKNSHLCGLI